MRKETGSCHIGGFLIILFAQLPGDVIAAALTEEEAYGLDNCHHGKDHAYGTGGCIAVQLADEIGVCHIVEGSNQHTDDAGNCQLSDQPAYRRLGHHFELGFVFIHKTTNILFSSIIHLFFQKST